MNEILRVWVLNETSYTEYQTTNGDNWTITDKDIRIKNFNDKTLKVIMMKYVVRYYLETR